MRASSDLLGDADALRARLDEDSYLFLPGLLDRDKVLALRHDIVDVLAERKWLRAVCAKRRRISSPTWCP